MIVLATSIAPGARLDIQRDAIASWLAQDVAILSLNVAEEIRELAPHFPGVRFSTAPRSAQNITGRPHVFIDDLLSALADTNETVIGIVNSDIRCESVPGLSQSFRREAADALLCGPRLDVQSWGDPTGRTDPLGFDFFCFPRTMIPIWPASSFCLGQGHWDHWLPLSALLNGHRTKKLLPAIGRHIMHPTERDQSFFYFADEFASRVSVQIGEKGFGEGLSRHEYSRLRAQAEVADEAARGQAMENLARYIDELTRTTIRFIDRNSEKIALV